MDDELDPLRFRKRVETLMEQERNGLVQRGGTIDRMTDPTNAEVKEALMDMMVSLDRIRVLAPMVGPPSVNKMDISRLIADTMEKHGISRMELLRHANLTPQTKDPTESEGWSVRETKETFEHQGAEARLRHIEALRINSNGQHVQGSPKADEEA